MPVVGAETSQCRLPKMASATPPRRRQLTIVEACTSPRAATAYEKETSQPLVDPQKLQEFRNIEESYIQAWIKESTRLARSAAPTVQASRRIKRESEPSQTQESVADALDSIGRRLPWFGMDHISYFNCVRVHLAVLLDRWFYFHAAAAGRYLDACERCLLGCIQDGEVLGRYTAFPLFLAMKGGSRCCARDVASVVGNCHCLP